jgi:hypothetical protein
VSSKWTVSFSFPTTSVYIIPHTCHMPIASHPPWCAHPNNVCYGLHSYSFPFLSFLHSHHYFLPPFPTNFIVTLYTNIRLRTILNVTDKFPHLSKEHAKLQLCTIECLFMCVCVYIVNKIKCSPNLTCPLFVLEDSFDLIPSSLSI